MDQMATGAVEYAISEVLRLPQTDQRDDALYHLRQALEKVRGDQEVMAMIPFLILMLSQSSAVKRAVSRKISGNSQPAPHADRVETQP